jgi:broad specificity phosphatase PhoE
MMKHPVPVPIRVVSRSLAPSADTLLWLIRHAEVESRYQGVFGGQIDMELSTRGHQQAAALAQYLRSKTVSAIYASPMRRVQQTLQPWVVNGVPRPVIMPDLREVNFGAWTGLTFGQVQDQFGVSAWAWLSQLECAAVPKAESAAMFRSRIEPCLRQIVGRHPGQDVAIACHGGVIRMLLAILLDIPFSRTGAFQIEYASLTQVRLRPEQTELQLVNFTPWREIVP